MEEFIIQEGNFKGLDLNKFCSMANQKQFRLFLCYLQPGLKTAFSRLPEQIKKLLAACGIKKLDFEE